MSKIKLSRREKEKNRHKNDVLNAALRLFSEKGFYNVSMQEIAEKSEFGVGTLYNFFENKESLFEELIKNCAQRIQVELLEVLNAAGTPEKVLKDFIRLQPQFQESHGDIIRLYVTEFGMRGSKLSKLSDETKLQEILVSKVGSLIQLAIDEGSFRKVSSKIAAKGLIALLETLIFETTGKIDKTTAVEMFDEVEKLFINGLLIEKK